MSPSEAVKKINPGVFLLGLVWTVGGPLLPVGDMIYEMHKHGPINWVIVQHQAVLLGGASLWAYWRKYKALLKVPAFVEEAWRLKQGVSVRTTVITTGRASDPDPVVSTKVEETHILAPVLPVAGETTEAKP